MPRIAGFSGARRWVRTAAEYTFTPLEARALRPFFTNAAKRVFFIFSFPPSVLAALLSMYSRMENARGIRGHFVDNLLPLILLSFSERFKSEPASAAELKFLVEAMQKFIREHHLTSLEAFVSFSEEHRTLFGKFIRASADPVYFRKLASSPRFRWFMALFLDKYGHNSIARGATLTFGVEGISILAAKSFEWGRPGAGYIELSTRFVRMDKAQLYPFWEDLDSRLHGDFAARVERETRAILAQYQMRMSKGNLEAFFREAHAEKTPERELAAAVKGEACDLLGNLLPAATLTSLGVSVSGEAFPELIKHLLLDNTPENIALAELIMEESEKIGGDQFLRHVEITSAKREDWRYLSVARFFFSNPSGLMGPKILNWVGEEDLHLFSRMRVAVRDFGGEDGVYRSAARREPHDKLPNQFEYFSGFFRGIMSFRGWRDLERHGFCTHFRTYLTPEIGFYRYDKPAPQWLHQDFTWVHALNRKLYHDMRNADVPHEICQYAFALGNMVGFQMGGNLAQWEFVIWQRSKFSVNHEVRQVALQMDAHLRKAYYFWREIARADRTPAYLFARTSKGIPYGEPEESVRKVATG
ncbi:MAG: FAD-dependent thymidylate synthase [Candidatus Brennerbacteria bacterium]|nr:FAD-dependent thymidylate synthase [Candidatus Brennerbacteria bacterium]